jgi:hypothetical protein
MRPRQLVVCAVAIAAMVAPAAAAQAKPAVAKQASGATAAAARSAKPVKPAQPTKPVKVPFTVTGAVTGVDAVAGTITIAATGGTKDLRGRTLTVTVATGAKIVVDDARAALATVQAGHQITAVGVRAGAVLTATKISTTAPEVDTPETPEA